MEILLSLMAIGFIIGLMFATCWTVSRSRASAVLGETFNLRK